MSTYTVTVPAESILEARAMIRASKATIVLSTPSMGGYQLTVQEGPSLGDVVLDEAFRADKPGF